MLRVERIGLAAVLVRVELRHKHDEILEVVKERGSDGRAAQDPTRISRP